MAQEPKPTIIYIFDPICGWCYTFNPVIEHLHARYKHKVDFVVVSGGMITGKRMRPISEMSEFILSGYKDMENLTGAHFGEKYLKMVETGTEMLDSEKPSFALTAFKTILPEKVVAFAHLLQKAHFEKGQSYHNDSTYVELARSFNINEKLFIEKMNSDSIKIATHLDFKKTEESGISSFPTMLLQINGKVTLLAEGFNQKEYFEKKMDKMLKSGR